METVYLYAHRNPVINDIFYVGIGTKYRASNLSFKSRNKLWISYVKKHGLPIVEILKSGLSRNDACELEELIISTLGRKITNEGILTNLSTGGEIGSFGVIRSEETKLKQSIAGKRRINPPLSDQAKRKLSLFFKGRPSPLKGRKQSEEHINKMIQSTRGLKRSDEARKNIAKAKTGVARPDVVIKQSIPVFQFTLSGNFIREYSSAVEAGTSLGIDNSSISKNCKGKSKQCGGYKWSFKKGKHE